MDHTREDSINFFMKYMKEAEGDTPPDVAAASTGDDNAPPDMPEDPGDAGPPDIEDDIGGDVGMDDGAPPELDDGFGDDEGFGGDDMGDEGQEENPDLGLDEKVSAIMNQQLYQRYLNLLSSISNQLTMMKNNNDILYTLSNKSVETESDIKKLDENIRLYLKYNFSNENYSKNLLFFNKCLNLFKLLNDSFDQSIRKGIKEL